MSALIIAARARKDSREERRWTLLSLLFLNSKGPFFFSLSFYLLKPLTSLEEAILHPSEREQKWYCSHFQEHPPGDLLRSQCFLGHHFLLFLLSCLSGFSSPISQLFSFTYSLNASAHQGCARDHFLSIQTLAPTPGSLHYPILMIHKDRSPGQPRHELQIPIPNYLLDTLSWMAWGLLNPVCPKLIFIF